MSPKMTRRSFLRNAGLGTGALIAPNFLDKLKTVNIIPRAQSTTLTVAGIPGQVGELLQLVAANFMAANPDVEVIVNIAGGAETEWKPGFPQIVGSDDKPDVAWYWVDGRQYQDIANAGLLEPLDDLYESENWNSVFPESTLRLYTQPDGHKYAVNNAIVWYPQIYYNIKAFETAGVEIPEQPYFPSMEAFYEACEKLRAAGYEPLTMGGKEGWIIGHTHDALLSRVATDEQLGDLLFNWREGSTPLVHYTEPPWTTANSLLLEMANKNVFAEGFLGRSYAEGRALFVQEKAAMYQDGSWAPTEAILYTEAPDVEFGWMLYPQVDPNISPKFLLYAGNGIMIPAGIANVDLAKQFVAFLMSTEQLIEQISLGVVPPRSDIPAEALESAGPHVAEMFPKLAEIGSTTGWDDPIPANMAERSHLLWQDLLAGRIPVEQVGEDIEELAERHRNG